MNKRFSLIGVVTRPTDETVEVISSGLRDFLDGRAIGYRPVQIAPSDGPDARVTDQLRDCDLIIVLGGDGTLLATARIMVGEDIPLLCVNLGRLGFLASVSPYDLFNVLDEILHGQLVEERRMMLQASIYAGDEVVASGKAFNEVTLHRWDGLRMIEFDTSIDGRFLNHQRADGIIVATPSGSTAYALSSGGPIVYPTLESLVLVPISPHAVGIRPMMLPAESRVEITLSANNREPARITFDGQGNHPLTNDQRVLIQRTRDSLRLVHAMEYDYFELLRAKLNWGK